MLKSSHADEFQDRARARVPERRQAQTSDTKRAPNHNRRPVWPVTADTRLSRSRVAHRTRSYSLHAIPGLNHGDHLKGKSSIRMHGTAHPLYFWGYASSGGFLPLAIGHFADLAAQSCPCGSPWSVALILELQSFQSHACLVQGPFTNQHQRDTRIRNQTGFLRSNHSLWSLTIDQARDCSCSRLCG